MAIGDPEWAMIYSEIIRSSQNVEVVFCKSYGELLKALADRRESPTLWVFLDYSVPGIKGTDAKQVNEAIKAIRKDAIVSNPVSIKI